MATRVFAALAACALISIPVRAMDAGLTALVMPGARVLAGIHVQQALASPFGQYVLSRMQKNEPALQQLQDATGFDPRRDLSEVLLASTADAAAGHPAGLALARGAFDVTRITAAAEARGLTVETVNGVTFIANPARKGAVALFGSDLAAAGNADEVRAAIARRDAPTVLDPALSARADELSMTQDAWAVSLAPPPVAGARLPDPTLQALLNSGILNGVQQTSGGVKFGANVDVTAEAVAGTAQDAASLASVIRLLAALGQSKGGAANLAPLFESLSVTTQGNAVRLALSVPEALAEQLTKPRDYSHGTLRVKPPYRRY